MAVRTNKIALRNLIVDVPQRERKRALHGLRKVEPFLSANVIEVHDDRRVSHAAIGAGAVFCLLKERPDKSTPLSLRASSLSTFALALFWRRRLPTRLHGSAELAHPALANHQARKYMLACIAVSEPATAFAVSSPRQD